ncbi:hypothetical protein CY35_08G057600 [Sphagnum magellanicum]|nr:hypothetical protein CY35_08G057600 [Sphagnum magellanicum]
MVPSSSFLLLPEVLAPGSTRCLRSCCCWVVNPRSSSRQELRICSRLGDGCWVLKRQLNCQGFVDQEASSSSVACRAFQEDDDDDDASSRCRGHGREVHRLPVLLHERGRKLQYVYSGQRMWTIDPQDESHYSKDGRFQGGPGDWLRECSEKMGRALRRSFVPDQVRPHYLLYLKWTMIHRFLSSINHVHCTQAMLHALGVGGKRGLPSAAALNWVLKDGLGRLGRLIYAAGLGRTFDCNLKRVRFSTSVLFCVSLGLEMLTPVFPHHFLFLATLANVGKSISLAAYLATSAQTVVADNLGLAVAVCINHFCHYHPRLGRILPLAMFPVLALVELVAIRQQLQAVHLQTLNKERLEIIVNQWVRDSTVPTFEDVSKVECAGLLSPYSGGIRQLPLRIGAIPLQSWTPEELMSTMSMHDSQRYVLLTETSFSFPWLGNSSVGQPGLLLWLNDKAAAEDIIMGVLQAIHVQAMTTTGTTLPLHGEKSRIGKHDERWLALSAESRRRAEAGLGLLLAAMDEIGWQRKHVLLSPMEQRSYSLLDNL